MLARQGAGDKTVGKIREVGSRADGEVLVAYRLLPLLFEGALCRVAAC